VFGAEFLIGFGIGIAISGSIVAFKSIDNEKAKNFWKKILG
jgi:hypothetical protein